MQTLAPHSRHLTRVDPSQNMARYYDVSLQATLFGEVVLRRHWGRIGTRGQVLMQTFDQAGAAVLAEARLVQAKQRRGYRPLE
jgi:predicted DNA-binding WGR domain protein